MRYIYGDSTPFPLAENFLVTLCAATEACVAILRADEIADEGTRQVRDVETKVTKELAQLSVLARKVEEHFGAETTIAASAAPTELATARICELAWSTVKQARAEILQMRDAAVVAANRSAPHALVLPALSAFLTEHQLPETSWSIRWRAGLGAAACRAETYGRAPCGIEATFEVDIPATHIWSRPLRVALLEKEITIRLTRKPWLRKPRPCPERLDKLFVTSIVHTPERAAMTLQRSAKEPSEGVEIVLRSEGSSEVTATRLGKNGAPSRAPEQLNPSDVAAVNRLWARIENTISDLVCHRRRLTAATMSGIPVGEIVHPEAVAEVLIQAIAPIVREIAIRTATPRELALKRYLGDGRREELFISYDTVLERITTLTERHQAKFDAFGLRERPAPRAVVRKLPPPAPVRQPPPAPARPPPLLRVVNG